MSFLMGLNIFHGFRFGMAKTDGFRPVTIPMRDTTVFGCKWTLLPSFNLFFFFFIPWETKG